MVNPVKNHQIDSAMVEKLAQMEYQPVQRLEKQQETLRQESELFQSFKNHVQSFVSSLKEQEHKEGFQKFLIQTSHPDAVKLAVNGDPLVGEYEIKVEQLARQARLLSEHFSSPQDEIGFGYLSLKVGEKLHHIRVTPSTTIQEVVEEINSQIPDVKAQLIQTRRDLEFPESNSYQIIVHSRETGKPASLFITPDLTDLQPQDLKQGQNLKIHYEGVEVFNDENQLVDLIPGLQMNFSQTSEDPVQISIQYDVESMRTALSEIISQYNQLNQFIHEQNTFDPNQQKAGPLGHESSLRRLRTNLRDLFIRFRGSNTDFQKSLMDFGITTNPDNGDLKLDEKKFNETFAQDERGSVHYFSQGIHGEGFLTKLRQELEKTLTKPYGSLSSKENEYQTQLQNLARQVEKNRDRADEKAQKVREKFQKLEGMLQEVESQNTYLKQFNPG